MTPEKKYFVTSIAAFGFAAIAGWDVFNNIVPTRNQIIRETPACSGLNLEYSNLMSSAKGIRDAARILQVPIADSNQRRLVECADSVERTVADQGLSPDGPRQQLEVGAIVAGLLAGYASGILAVLNRRIRVWLN